MKTRTVCVLESELDSYCEYLAAECCPVIRIVLGKWGGYARVTFAV